MIDIDEDYWIKGVELKKFRARLVFILLDLLDKEYQEEHWFDTKFD